jgi:hypothetical protein
MPRLTPEHAVADAETDAVLNLVIDAAADLVDKARILARERGASAEAGCVDERAVEFRPARADAAAEIRHPFVADIDVVPNVREHGEGRDIGIERTGRIKDEVGFHEPIAVGFVAPIGRFDFGPQSAQPSVEMRADRSAEHEAGVRVDM